MIRIPLLIGLLALGLVATADGETVQVAVAANFSAPMKQIASGFEAASGHHVATSLGATGKFYAQIKAGAPFQLLLSADTETPARLESEGDAVAGSRFTYAVGTLVLWSAKNNAVSGGDVLTQHAFTHLAVANPKLAPYGAAAVATMKSLGVLEALNNKLVFGENIAQTFQFAASGNAELGFVALSQVLDDNGKLASGSMWIVPQQYHSPLRQDAVLLQQGKDSVAAKALLAYLKSEPAQRIIMRYGYALPP